MCFSSGLACAGNPSKRAAVWTSNIKNGSLDFVFRLLGEHVGRVLNDFKIVSCRKSCRVKPLMFFNTPTALWIRVQSSVHLHAMPELPLPNLPHRVTPVSWTLFRTYPRSFTVMQTISGAFLGRKQPQLCVGSVLFSGKQPHQKKCASICPKQTFNDVVILISWTFFRYLKRHNPAIFSRDGASSHRPSLEAQSVALSWVCHKRFSILNVLTHLSHVIRVPLKLLMASSIMSWHGYARQSLFIISDTARSTAAGGVCRFPEFQLIRWGAALRNTPLHPLLAPSPHTSHPKKELHLM